MSENSRKNTKSDRRQSGERCSETVWMAVCLILFLILGPFSAPFALFAVFHHGWTQHPGQEPELLVPGESL